MPEEERPKKQTRAPGERSRARIVKEAAQLATIEGIEGLSIGRLADATGIAKSSVYALFGSKEELQLATINAARDSFITEVVAPALGATEPGRERLLALCDGFLSYVERRIFPGGCFFVAASAEVGRAPDASMTKWPVSNSSGETCSGARPAWQWRTANSRQTPTPGRSHSNLVSFLPEPTS